MRWPKFMVGLLLLLGPWPIFMLSVSEPGLWVTVMLFVTLAISAFGLMILIGGKK